MSAVPYPAAEKPKTDPAGVACIMVNYGAAGLIMGHSAETLAGLRAVPGSQLFVVDNASPGGDADRLREAFAAEDDVTVIAHDRNGGFAAGNNVGFAAMAAFEDLRSQDFAHVLLLNPDAWPSPRAVETLVAYAHANPRAGLLGPAIEGEDGERHRSAFRFPTWLGDIESRASTGVITSLLKSRVVAPAVPDAAQRTDWVSGAALLMNREIVAALGPMDEGYFLYFEETDYQLAAARAGFETWYVPEAVVTHMEGATTGQGKARQAEAAIPDYWFRSRRRYFEKNHGEAYADRADRAWLAANGFFVLRQKALGRSDLGRGAAAKRFRANVGQRGNGAPE